TPCMPPTTLLANSTMRSEMPLASMRLPARIKKGTATSGYLSSAAYSCWAMTIHGIWPSQATPKMLARPIDTATGTVSPKNRSIETIISCGMQRSCDETDTNGRCASDGGFVDGYLAGTFPPVRHDRNHGQNHAHR